MSVPLPPDDLAPSGNPELEAKWRRQLEQSIGKRFYEACNGVTQSLLMSCDWFVTTQARALTLVIHCPDAATNWRVLNHIAEVGNKLALFMNNARIRIYSSTDASPFEIRVDELSLHQHQP